MPRAIAAKPTLYRGVAFRSRLEARWAVVFDSLGIRWQYEPHTFDVGHNGYTPDFYIDGGDEDHENEWGHFVEVKPGDAVSRNERERIAEIARAWNQVTYHDDDDHGEPTALLLLGLIPRITSPEPAADPMFSALHNDGRGGLYVAGAMLCGTEEGYGHGSGYFTVFGESAIPESAVRWDPLLGPIDSVGPMSESVRRAFQNASLFSHKDF